MLDSILHPITLPSYREIKHLEGGGNYAVDKYYKLPWRPFYRKKLYMVLSLLDKGRIYKNILDFGCGPGILTPELKKRATNVVSIDKKDGIDARSRFECVVSASTLEFVDNLPETIRSLYRMTYTKSQMIVASPIDSKLTRFYFKAIGDNLVRNSHKTVMKIVDKYFKITDYKEWMGLYFAFKGYRR